MKKLSILLAVVAVSTLIGVQVAQAALLPTVPITCINLCGDNNLDNKGGSICMESCDDGAKVNGDGCSSTCQTEPGYYCDAWFGCNEICGDNLIVGVETCDDGNIIDDDGCTTVWFNGCAQDAGWTCSGLPSTCTPICGDGKIFGAETCDDGGISSGDGCSSSCQLEEKGWYCTPGQPCTTKCGDSYIAGTEACDDSNKSSNDGCSSSCQLETGWTCDTEGKACTSTCNDGVIVGTETCDDGNSEPNDGCDAVCTLEDGWYCNGDPSNCNTICGDDLVRGDEECDDDNTHNGDGCNSVCNIEEGWDCSGASCGVIDGPVSAPPESLVIPHFSGLIVEGYVTIYDIIVTTTAQFLGDLSVEGDMDVDGFLYVDGDVRLGNSATDNIQLSGEIVSYFGDIVIDDTLVVNSLEVLNTTTLGDDQWGDVTIGGDLTATTGIVTLGRDNIGDDVIVQGDLQVNGTSDITGSLQVDGSLIAEDTFVSRGLATIQDDLAVTGGITATGNIGSFYDVVEVVNVGGGSDYGFAVCNTGDFIVGCAAHLGVINGANDWLYGTEIYGDDNRGTVAPLQSCYAAAYRSLASTVELKITGRCFDSAGTTTGYITQNLY